METTSLRERLIVDVGAIRAENAKTRLWDSDERIADYLLSKGWTLPAREPNQKSNLDQSTRIRINQDKNDAFFGVGDVIRGKFPDGTTFEGEITCIDIKKEGTALHTVIDYKFPTKPGEPNQGSAWLENIVDLKIVRFKGE